VLISLPGRRHGRAVGIDAPVSRLLSPQLPLSYTFALRAGIVSI